MSARNWTLTGIIAMGLMLAIALPGEAGDKGKKIELPKAAADAISAAYPGAKIDEIELDDEDGVKLYEVELKLKGEEIEVSVSADGVIFEIETEITVPALPKAVADALAKVAKGGKITEVEKEEERAEVKDGKIVTLKTPIVTYSAEIRTKDGKIEVEFAEDGKVLEIEKKGAKHDDDDDDDD